MMKCGGDRTDDEGSDDNKGGSDDNKGGARRWLHQARRCTRRRDAEPFAGAAGKVWSKVF
jgi:hypothetical protein